MLITISEVQDFLLNNFLVFFTDKKLQRKYYIEELNLDKISHMMIMEWGLKNLQKIIEYGI